MNSSEFRGEGGQRGSAWEMFGFQKILQGVFELLSLLFPQIFQFLGILSILHLFL